MKSIQAALEALNKMFQPGTPPAAPTGFTGSAGGHSDVTIVGGVGNDNLDFSSVTLLGIAGWLPG